jgi:filamentous hemagglutinin
MLIFLVKVTTMSNRQHPIASKSSDDFFRLKPLAAGVRIVIAGGLFVGSGVAPVNAEVPSPLPVPTITPVTIGLPPVPIIDQAIHGQATAAITGKAMTINQITDKATIDWKSFNVDKGYSVNFVQPSSSSVALNNIHQADPSVILGTVTANGQIYLVNQNGFIFGKDSVVDANSVLVSALNISDEAFKAGIIRVFDSNPNANIADKAALNGTTNPNAKIQVDAGASLHVGKNGSIILAAPTVDNSGSISADQQGQILLVASQDKVYLQPASSSSPFAGLLVEVGKGGQVNNNTSGNVAVRQGNVTLAGFAVNQSGRLSATTSVNVNGSIRLLARETAIDSFDPKTNTHNLTASQTVRNSGTLNEQDSSVTLGQNSSVTVLADANGGTAIDEQAQKQSFVEVSADKIDMQSGSVIVATSGQVNLTASSNPLDKPVDAQGTPLVGTAGRIDLESGSRIDVSGTKNVQVAMARNVAAVSVQSFNLRDAPYQLGGVLKGQTVQVDIRNLPTIIDASTASASIQRGIDERLGGGGQINLTSAGDVVVNTGAVTDISGGTVNYQGGYINTTQLVSAVTGQVVDISVANPNVQYSGIYGVYKEAHTKWGVAETYNLMTQLNAGRFENGYTEGKAGGALTIQSPLTAWGGQLVAGAVTGIYQRSNPVSGGSLTFNKGDNGTFFSAGLFHSSQNVSFQNAAQLLNISLNNPVSPSDLVLSNALVNQSGISNLTVKTAGDVTVAKDAALSMPALSNFNVDAGAIDVKGSIYAAGGIIALNSNIALNPINQSQSTGQLNLFSTSVLDVSGRWVNDFQNGFASALTSPVVINAGTVSVNANSVLDFSKGAEINADGGAWLGLAGNRLTAGNAGSIQLTAGNSSIPGVMQADGGLSAYGLSQGGSLSLTTNKINVGAQILEANALNMGVTNGALDIAANAGFSTINLTSNNQNITVKANTDWSLMSQNRLFTPNYRNQASSSSLAGFSQVVTLPENIRKPVAISLTGQTGVTLETGSQIHVDKASTVNLTAENAGPGIYIDGLIDARGGAINLNLKADVSSLPYDGSQSIWLGSHAELTTLGTTLLNPVNALGRTGGSVLNGGNVNVKADRGYVVVEHGAVIDVSGTRASLDLPTPNSGGLGLQYSSQLIGSDAGKISITAAEGIVLDGTLNAKAGTATNLGGSLNLSLDRNQRKELQGFPVNPPQFNVVQNTQVVLPVNAQFGSIPTGMNGQATISSQQIAQAGIDQLRLTVPLQPLQEDSNNVSLPRLPGVINFMGDVNLNTASSIVLDTQVIDWSGLNGSLTGAVNLNTAYLQLGSSTYNAIIGTSLPGGGKLTTHALWTQLEGASLMSGFSDVSLNSVHDLRAVGVLDPVLGRSFTGNLSTAANLNLNASQIYPSTLTNYTFSVTDPAKQLTITGNNTDTSPLSAAGQLTLNAAIINQNGVLKAPLGTIALNATTAMNFGKGSFTSVSANGQTIPFGALVNNIWEYPLAGGNNLVFNQLLLNSDTKLYEYLSLGEKHLIFQSPDIQFNTGSVVDVSGGGNLQAYQFQPGLGGSNDYLLPGSASYQGGFAILPSLGSALAPFDPNLSANFAYNPGASVYLSGTATLAAGFYTILPSRYALLPGAYLVTPQANTQDQMVTSYTTTGLSIVSGYQTLAGTNVRTSRSSGFLIESAADVQKHSQYNIQTANSFFTQQALTNNTSVPLLPVDSGQISIDASTKLVLDGQFKVAAPNGRGAKMDISARNQNIEVVTRLSSQATPGTLQLLDQNLSQLHVDSLLLGGTRQSDSLTGNTNLTVTANNVTFDQGTQLQTLDLVAAAKSTVEVKSGAKITSSGTVNTGESVFNITGNSALLRISADKQVTVNHSSPNSTGSLLIDQGADLSASKSMLLDASSTVLNGNILMHGGSLKLSANSINIGDIPSGLTGNTLNLTNQQLTNLSVDELVLNSQNSVNLYGNVGQIDSNGNLSPIVFNSLVVDAASLSGFGSSGQAAKLQATNLVLANPLNAIASAPGTGQGSLDLLATNFTQGAGKFGLNGFNAINLTVNNGFIADGKSVMNVAGDMNLNAGYLTTTGGSSLTLDAGGHALQINGNGSSYTPVASVFGGSMAFIGNTVGFNTNALLSSGALSLHALTGDVTVGSAATIDLAGKAVAFADILDYTPGGTFTAIADSGSVSLASGSKLDVSTGGGLAAGGNLVFKAANLNQNVTLVGDIKAKGGSATFDVSTFSTTFDSLMTVLNSAGVTNSIYFRSRDAGIVDTANINANNITLVADKGVVDISGQLNANSIAQGGNINVDAGDKITLEAGSLLTATGNKGGNVLLSSVDSLVADHSGIELKAGSTIDVGGSTAGGKVTLSALRTSSDGINTDGINIKPIAGTVNGASQFYAQGVQKYSSDNIDSLIATVNSDTLTYMAAASTNVANLGQGLTLRPGVEIDYAGPIMSQNAAWDFSSLSQPLSPSDTPIVGSLIIRAGGQLNMNGFLTDGFSNGVLQNGDSWSFQLVSGADLNSADKFATVNLTAAEKLANPTLKDLTIGSGVSIHTGSGDIKLATGGNLVFADQTSTVYNAGRADIANPYGSLASGKRPVGDYPIAGGDLVIRTGGDINGAISSQFLNAWLTRQGTVISARASRNTVTAWAVKADQFQQNIGSFGGGKVDIAASGNINDLSVMMPTTGKQLGTSAATNALQIQGGGSMQVKAGGDISGGAYFLGMGDGVITAGGQIKGSTSIDTNAFTAGPQIVMSGNQSDPIGGNSKLTLNAATGIKIAAVSDAMVLTKDNPEFFTYTDKSKLLLNSLAGDIHLNSDTSVINAILGINNPNEQQLSTVYPASVDVTAFGGSVKLDHDIILFPSATSNVKILANQAITSTSGQYSLIMADANPSLLPNIYSTINAANDQRLLDAASVFNTQAIDASGIPGVSKGGASPLIHAATPIHSGDKQAARLITKTGDISSVQIILPKQAIIQAGNDLKNTPIQIQQVNQTDSSIISAGRDIVFATDLDRNGVPTDKNSLYQISISGPGSTLVKTGRNLDLGASVGLTTIGNLYNSALPSAGASIDVLVGLNAGTPSYSAFIDKYLLTNPLYIKQLAQVETLITGFMQQRTGNTLLSTADALKAFANLTGDQTLIVQPKLNVILTQVFFNELKIAGSASASNKALGNQGGFAAIDTLFPGNQWKGDLNLFFSKLQTVNGGNINLMVPGGQINAGLAVAPSGSGAKTADKLGIVAQAQGDINAFVKNDFTVNTSRVFTLGGGDILIWSSEGNIDAGKGAKSALAVTVDAPYYDSNNQLVIPAPKITSGSGIRTAASPGTPAGNVFLFAPKGVVDAGEAGIGGTNVTISATAVLGANNIQVGGVSTGVPAASTGSLAAGLTGTSNMTANVSQVAQAVTGVDEKGGQNNKNAALGMFSVEVLGFGD